MLNWAQQTLSLMPIAPASRGLPGERFIPNAGTGAEASARRASVAIAMSRLEGARAMLLKNLRLDVQADFKSLWTSYEQSLKESEGFLFGMGNVALVQAAIANVTFGKKPP
jgi:hypothetical protein